MRDWVEWHQVEVREADASRPECFADTLPADVLLLCGIFGNVSEADIERTAMAAPAFDALDTSTLAAVGVGRLRDAPGAGLPSGPLFIFRPTPRLSQPRPQR